MTLTLPLIILGASLWVLLLGGCIVFATLSGKFKRQLASERQQLSSLRDNLVNKAEKGEEGGEEETAIASSEEPLDDAIEVPIAQPVEAQVDVAEIFAERDTLQALVNDLQAKLSAQSDPSRNEKKENKHEEKYLALKQKLDNIEEDLADAEEQITTLDGANQALQAERDSLTRQLDSLSESIEATSDAETMREMIVNFTEESRELLEVIEQLGKEKSELQQKIADMEAGGKGTAGAVIGLKRKLDEAHAQIKELQGEGDNSAA